MTIYVGRILTELYIHFHLYSWSNVLKLGDNYF